MSSYSTVAEAIGYHPAASGEAQASKAADILSDAADLVRKYAPANASANASSEATSDYESRAAKCERRLFAALWDTGGGYISGTSISGATSDSFAGLDPVIRIVASVMGPYFVDPEAPAETASGSSYTLDVASSFPPAGFAWPDTLPRA